MNWPQLLFLLLISLPLSASSLEIFFELTSLGGNDYRYTYMPSGHLLLAGQEIAIEFPADSYGSISNGLPDDSPGWDLLLLQPNSPPGAPGFYALLATVDGPFGPPAFSVDFTWIGAGMPGAQPFTLIAYDPDTFEFLEVLQTGVTQSDADPLIPEPGTALLLLSGVLITVLGRARELRRAPR